MLGTIIIIVVGVLLAAVLVFWLFGEHWRPLLPSTWRMMREAGLRRFLNLSGLHGYVYGRWIKEYIGVLINYIYPRFGPRGKKWQTDHYHGKVLTPELARAIITIDHKRKGSDLLLTH